MLHSSRLIKGSPRTRIGFSYVRKYAKYDPIAQPRMPRPDVSPRGIDVEGHTELQKMRKKFLGIMEETEYNNTTKQFLNTHFPNWKRDQVNYEANQPIDLLSPKSPTEMLTVPGLDPLDLDDDVDMAKALAWVMESSNPIKYDEADGVTDHLIHDTFSKDIEFSDREIENNQFHRLYSHAKQQELDPTVGPMLLPMDHEVINDILESKTDQKVYSKTDIEIMGEMMGRPKVQLKEEMEEKKKKGLDKGQLIDLIHFWSAYPHAADKEVLWNRLEKSSIVRRLQKKYKKDGSEGEPMDYGESDDPDDPGNYEYQDDKGMDEEFDEAEADLEEEEGEEGEEGEVEAAERGEEGEGEADISGIERDIEDENNREIIEEEPDEAVTSGLFPELPRFSTKEEWGSHDDEFQKHDQLKMQYSQKEHVEYPATEEDIDLKYDSLLTADLLFPNETIDPNGNRVANVQQMLNRMKWLNQQRDKEKAMLRQRGKHRPRRRFDEKILNFEKYAELEINQHVSFSESALEKKLSKQYKQESLDALKKNKDRLEFGEYNPEEPNEEDKDDFATAEVLHDEMEEKEYIIEDILSIGRHTQITAAGRIYSFSALLLLGTGRGAAALGYGRADNVPDAIKLARLQAENNMLTITPYRGGVGADIYRKFKKSRAFILAKAPGHGFTASWEMERILLAFGLTDVTIAVGGSRNVGTRYRAVFLGLRDGVRSPELVSRVLGRKLFDRDKAYYYKGE